VISLREYLTNLKEEDLFHLLKSKIIPDLQKTDQFNSIDAFSLERRKFYELKCRRADYVDLLIEKLKWDNFKSKGQVYYINSTPRGIYSFNIRKIIEPKWEINLMPKTTQFENTSKVEKIVGYLNIYRDAHDITDLLI
jgi:hypothetical protein